MMWSLLQATPWTLEELPPKVALGLPVLALLGTDTSGQQHASWWHDMVTSTNKMWLQKVQQSTALQERRILVRLLVFQQGEKKYHFFPTYCIYHCGPARQTRHQVTSNNYVLVV